VRLPIHQDLVVSLLSSEIGRVFEVAAPSRPRFDRIAAFDRILRLSKPRTQLFTRRFGVG
jgi:hypothetical protein